MIRDRIVLGRDSRKIREKLINEGLALNKAIDIAWTYEMSQLQMKSMEEGEEVAHSIIIIFHFYSAHIHYLPEAFYKIISNTTIRKFRNKKIKN